jgi:hypothetical protein
MTKDASASLDELDDVSYLEENESSGNDPWFSG